MSSFGSGLGTLVGSSLANSQLENGLNSVNNNVATTENQTQPFVNFGQSFLPTATAATSNLESTANNVEGYNQFMSNYQTSPGAQYQIGVADAAQNNSAAASGTLLSGANQRALSGINQGIASTYANQAYSNYLQGNQQQFGQLQSALGDMFNAIGVGTTATGQDVSLVNGQNAATSSIAQAEAKNDQSKGSGLGSLFNGVSSLLPTAASF